jgi:predicted ATPase/DNA-binding SARP family transcriptional activator
VLGGERVGTTVVSRGREEQCLHELSLMAVEALRVMSTDEVSQRILIDAVRVIGVRFNILGSLSVVDGEEDVEIPGTKTRLLLAVLLVRRGETVSSDRLIEELWGDSPPAGVQNALQALVSKLRRRLGTAGRLLRTDQIGYRLDVEADDIDAQRFSYAIAKAHDALVGGDAITASDLLSGALALWRGDALEGLAFEGLLHREATRLEELRLAAMEDHCDAALRLGRHTELVAYSATLVEAYPLRERLHGFLMLALYRSQRHAEALRAYQDARAVFGEELGLEPGPELRALEIAMINEDPALELVGAPPARPAPRLLTNLVSSLSSFIGRSAEIDEVQELVERHRLVTIVGTGGAGKTRLALEVAERFRDTRDVWVVELAPIGDPEGIANAFGVALGLGSTGAATAVTGAGSAIGDVLEFLSDRDVLIVLDNCEHVIAEAAGIADRIISTCAGVRILATSREGLGLTGEFNWHVPPMDLHDVVSLFIDRASAASGFVASDANAVELRDLCSRLDGLPLAVELAAGRVRTIPVRQLASRLDDRFKLLTGGSRNAMPRQQTLRAVVSWSYDLLFADEQRVFDRLAVFAGGCTLEASEAVCGGDDVPVGDIGDLLAHLVDKSLIIADHTAGDVRFHLLQTLAVFGRDRLVETGTSAEIRNRHARYYAEIAARGWKAFRGHEQVSWLDEVRREADNMNAALGWAIDQNDVDLVDAMLAGLGWSWMFSARHDEGWRWLQTGLRLQGSTSLRKRARAAMWAAWCGATGGHDLDLARAYAAESVELHRAAGGGNPELLVALGTQGFVLSVCGDLSGALAAYEEAAHGGDGWDSGLGVGWAARVSLLRGARELGEQLHRESIQNLEAAGMRWAAMFAHSEMATLEEQRGDIDAAVTSMGRALAAARELRLVGFEGLLSARMAMLALFAGDIDGAADLTATTIALADQSGNVRAMGIATHVQAVLALGRRELELAAARAQSAHAMLAKAGPATAVLPTLATLGIVAELRGNLAEATQSHLDALQMARDLGDDRWVAIACSGLAGVAAARGDGHLAALLLGAARGRNATAGTFGYATDLDRIRTTIAAMMDPGAVARLLDEGDGADIDQLLDGM